MLHQLTNHPAIRPSVNQSTNATMWVSVTSWRSWRSKLQSNVISMSWSGKAESPSSDVTSHPRPHKAPMYWVFAGLVLSDRHTPRTIQLWSHWPTQCGHLNCFTTYHTGQVLARYAALSTTRPCELDLSHVSPWKQKWIISIFVVFVPLCKFCKIKHCSFCFKRKDILV